MKLELIDETIDNNAEFTADSPRDSSDASLYIGPARVLEVRGKQVLMSASDKKVWAFIALAYDYAPVVNDILLVLGKRDAWYVTGVIEGSGNCKWTVSQNLEISAPRGAIRVSAANGIQLHAPKMDLVSEKLRVIATSLVERIATVQRIITDMLNVHAKRVRVEVDTTHRMTARRIRHRAREDVKVDGSKIHLG